MSKQNPVAIQSDKNLTPRKDENSNILEQNHFNFPELTDEECCAHMKYWRYENIAIMVEITIYGYDSEIAMMGPTLEARS